VLEVVGSSNTQTVKQRMVGLSYFYSH